MMSLSPADREGLWFGRRSCDDLVLLFVWLVVQTAWV
jgi:hypothetical protein